MVQGGKKTLKSMQIYTARRCKADCQTGLVLLFISMIVLLPISTLGLVVKSLGVPCREYATEIKMRVQNWRKRGWRKDKRKNRILLLQQACVPVWFYLLSDTLLNFLSIFQNGRVHTYATMTTAHKHNYLHSKT